MSREDRILPWRGPPAHRALGALALRAIVLVLTITGYAFAAPKLHISGTATLEVSAEAHELGVVLRGRVTDEVGRGLESAQLRVEADDASGASSRLRTCGRPSARAERGPLTLRSDDSGRFCVEMSEARDGSARLRFSDPRGYYAPIERAITLSEPLVPPVEVGFSPTPALFPLEQSEHRLRIETRGHAPAQERERELVVSIVVGEKARELARERFAPGADALELVVPSSSLGEPGPARLIARVLASSGGALAEASAAILVTVTVKVALAGGKSTFDREQPLQVTVRSTLGPVNGGLVEVEQAGQVVAAARVARGVANIAPWPRDPANAGLPARVRYLGTGPGLLADQPLELWPAHQSSLGLGWLWILAALAAAAVVASNFLRPALPAARPRPPEPQARAAIEFLQELGAGGGYRGRVVDAHDGAPVVGAVVSILAPGKSDWRVLVQVRAGADGAFVIEPQPFEPSAALEVTAKSHVRLTAPLPKPGVFDLALIARRRALLERLVRWAEPRGAPWVRDRIEPTPAHVAGAALSADEAEVAKWASEIERLAFGEAEPDESAERALGADPKTSAERGID